MARTSDFDSDDFDSVFAAQLEKDILRKLHGDGAQDGLYRNILSSPDWDSFTRAKGIIYAYEEVLEIMHELIRKVNEPNERA